MDAITTPIAPIGAHTALVLLLQLGTLLGLALVLGQLAVRLRMPAVVGELTAGVLLGPSLFGQLAPTVSGWLLPHDPGQQHLLDAVGQLGVLLLVGVTGMHIDLALLRRRSGAVATVSTGSLVLPIGMGIVLGMVLPAALIPSQTDRVVFALFLGVAMGVSALPVIAKTLLEMRLMHRNVGQLIMNSAAVSDIIGWLMLSVVSAIATSGALAGQVGRSLLYLALILLITVLVGRPAVRIALRLAARSHGAAAAVGGRYPRPRHGADLGYLPVRHPDRLIQAIQPRPAGGATDLRHGGTRPDLLRHGRSAHRPDRARPARGAARRGGGAGRRDRREVRRRVPRRPGQPA
jgi:hypothetical protein